MKKIILSSIILFMACYSYGQTLSTTNVSDWNKVYQSGFYESLTSTSQNNPISSYQTWFWGINSAHTANGPSYRFNGQILFRVNIASDVIPEVFVRSTNQQGEGIWARMLHSKGNHSIDGKLTVKEVEVKVNTGADFVFEPDYNLTPLSEVETFIKTNKHLPEIPSEKEMQEKGVNLNDMQIKLLQKIEELTLYIIEQNKYTKQQQEQLDQQAALIKELQEQSSKPQAN